jgi:putative sigma-54 modulation protein
MVDIHITGVRYTVSDKVRDYINDKLGGLSRYHGGLKRLNVTIHPKEKHGFRVDVDMHLPNGQDVVAHDSEDTVYSAIDVVSDKAASQLRKIHEKQTERHRQSDRHRV